LGILDLNSKDSIKTFKDWYTQKYQTVDCIVNNAGFAFWKDGFIKFEYKNDASDKVVFEETFLCNFDGTIFFQETMSNCINANGIVIFLASTAGQFAFNFLKSKEIQSKFLDSNLNLQRLYELKSEMLAGIDTGTLESSGWPRWAYGLSKTFLMFAVGHLANLPEYVDRNIQMYNMCPGFCQTNMTRDGEPPKSAEEGADTIIW